MLIDKTMNKYFCQFIFFEKVNQSTINSPLISFIALCVHVCFYITIFNGRMFNVTMLIHHQRIPMSKKHMTNSVHRGKRRIPVLINGILRIYVETTKN